MSMDRKQEYVKSGGALKDEIIDKEMARLIDDGHAIQGGGDLELTSDGKTLHKRMTRQVS
jgi:hypothetical protein